MRSILSLIFVVAISQILCAAQEKGESSSEVVLKEGGILPGPFYPFVVHGPRKDRLRAIINEKPEKTFILMFFQGANIPDFLPKSLEDLNVKIKGNKTKGFPSSAMAIFVNPEIKNVVRDDEKRNEFVKALRTAIAEEKSDFIEVGVDDLADLQKYKLEQSTSILMIRCENLKAVKILKLDATNSNEDGFSKGLSQLLESAKAN